MYKPSKQQFGKVIATLEKAVELANGNCPVDMAQGDVFVEHPCGTPMCHGGWYSLVLGYPRFDAGAEQMAEDLGFTPILNLDGRGTPWEDPAQDQLAQWAKNNPQLWGNVAGSVMFIDESAFGVVISLDDDLQREQLSPELTLQMIIDHWKGVMERTLAHID